MFLSRTVIVPLLFIANLVYAQRVDKMDPPNWWVGMQQDTCHILLYGTQLSDYQPYTNHQGVKVRKSADGSDSHYLMISLIISNDAKPGNVPISLKGQSLPQLDIEFPLLQRIPRSTPPINSSDVIYLITPDRFANGDPKNDISPDLKEKPDRSNPDGRHGGDIAGIQQSLPYLKDIGMTTLWLNPVQTNNMPEYSYHGYAITDFYNIDPRFGTLNEYVRFVKEAHQQEMKVMMDIVVNHCGFDHQWILYPPFPEWTTNYDAPYEETNHAKTAVMDPYVATSDLDQLVNGWFVKSMPDINTRHPLVEKYFIQNAIWWIETAALDGLRVDTYPYPDKEFSSRWIQAITNEYKDLYVVGEVWNYQPGVIAYWQKDNRNKDGYNSNLPGLFDFPLQGAITDAFKKEGNLNNLYEAVAMDFQYHKPDNFVIFGDNHDMSRMFTVFNQHFPSIKNAVTFISTFRGIPQFFYGTEILMDNSGTDKHGIIRSDFPGGWQDDKINAFTTIGLNPTQIEFQLWMSKLLNWRKSERLIHEGKVMHYQPKDGVYVYFRYDDTGAVMVILNKNEKATSLSLSRFNQRLKGYNSATELFTGKKIKLDRTLKLLAEEPVILTLSK